MNLDDAKALLKLIKGDAPKLDAVGQAIDMVLGELEGRISGNDYQQAAMRTAAEKDPVRLLQNGVLGLAGESGEVADHLKKHLFQGHELSRKHVAEELGDICWYVAVSSYAIGYDMEEIFRINVKKLMKRYPNGFEKERSLNREPERL